MVTVGGRRKAVGLLVERRISERRACELIQLGRSSYRYQAVSRPDEEPLRQRLRELALHYPRFGYRRQGVLLRRAGMEVNHKRVYRLWKQEGLSLPRRRPRKRRVGPQGEIRKKPRYVNHVWSYDFVFDGLIGGQGVKILAVVDDFTRRCLTLKAGTSIRGSDVQWTLERLFHQYGRPDSIRSDNGPEFLSREVCRWLESQKTETVFITPGSPWENAYVESFLGKFRDECLNREWFLNLRECQYVIESWRRHYNEVRPHSSLGYRTPAETINRVEASGSAPLRQLPQPNNPDPGRLTF